MGDEVRRYTYIETTKGLNEKSMSLRSLVPGVNGMWDTRSYF